MTQLMVHRLDRGHHPLLPAVRNIGDGGRRGGMDGRRNMARSIKMENDMQRSKERCPACARLQRELETGQFVASGNVAGKLFDAPRRGGKRTRSATSSLPDHDASKRQHVWRPENIICNHCLCSHESHEETGPNGQKCCGRPREGPWDRLCEWCRSSKACKTWARVRPCTAEGTLDACEPGAKGDLCTHCLCSCSLHYPHRYDDKSMWVGR